MAVQVLQDWAIPPFASGTADPSGAVTLGTGTNRTLIYVMYGRITVASATASVAIGGQAATGYQKEDWNYTSAGANVGVYSWYWNEAAVAAISAAGSSNVTYSDNQVNWRDRGHTYATFGSVDQTTPISIVTARSSTVTSASAMTLNYAGSAGDHVAVIAAGIGPANTPEFYDGTITERINATTSSGAWALADGAWASTATSFRHDENGGALGTFLGWAARFNQLVAAAVVSGSGSVDGLIATVAGVGKRVITGSGSIDSILATIAGAGTAGSAPPFEDIVRIARAVRLDDESYGFRNTIQGGVIARPGALNRIVGKGAIVVGDYHAGTYLTDEFPGGRTRIEDIIAKSVIVQGLD